MRIKVSGAQVRYRVVCEDFTSGSLEQVRRRDEGFQSHKVRILSPHPSWLIPIDGFLQFSPTGSNWSPKTSGSVLFLWRGVTPGASTRARF